jgi:Protein of unknown function (DUF3987)
MRPTPAPEPFPIDALGSDLADAAKAVRDVVQAPIEMCAGGVLASASLAVSAHLDVRLPFGEAKPVSIYVWTIAESGERKTSIDRRAFAAHVQREQKLRIDQISELERYRIEHATWEAQSKAIAREFQKLGEAGSAAHREELQKLGPEPEKPLEPLMIGAEFTYEGLVRCLKMGQPLYGIIGSEGGQFVGGHGMTEEAKLRTIAGLSDAWDGNPIKRVRANEIVALSGRRVGMHLMLQPKVAGIALSDDLVTKQGFLARILMAAPESLIGTRMHKEAPPDAERIIARYNQRVLTILETPYSLVKGTRSELDPPELPFSEEAEQLYWEFADEVEREMAAGGKYETIRSFASKLPEHAARLAATIAGFHNLHITKLGPDDFTRGIKLAVFYASEAKRIAASSWGDPALLLAQKLLDWLLDSWSKPDITARAIYTYGPNSIRSKKTALELVKILTDYGWLRQSTEAKGPYLIIGKTSK